MSCRAFPSPMRTGYPLTFTSPLNGGGKAEHLLRASESFQLEKAILGILHQVQDAAMQR